MYIVDGTGSKLDDPHSIETHDCIKAQDLFDGLVDESQALGFDGFSVSMSSCGDVIDFYHPPKKD